ncbi:U3 small nucleolar RNA-associated protein 4 [Candida viswanathii]|uniref:U3 small nucleolar RNA-associated protein 4 n=1 Tax=Candida viswanathii TaxID=5486 RepID=A0A367YI47_9ASCO|nr:U3 small nucleolar RNA-associated protein 4 [Candida viswanathii]
MDIHRCRFVDYTPHTITSLAFSHTSSLTSPPLGDVRLAVGRSNGDIEIWNPRLNWTHELTLPGSKGRSIEGLCWGYNHEEDPAEPPRLFSIGGSTYITEWDLTTGKPLVNYDCNAGIIWCIDINSRGDKLTVGCDDGSVVIVDISGGKGSLEYDLICQRQDARVLSVKWVGNESIIGGCADGRIRSWSSDQETRGRIMATMKVDKAKVESTLIWSLTVLPNKKQFVSGDSTGTVKIWDLETYTLLQSFKIHDADVLCLVHDVKEEKIFSAGVDRKIHQFDLITTKSSSKWAHSFNRLLHSNDVRSMAIFENKNHNLLVSGGVERAIVVQNIDHFYDGKYKKLLINQQISNTLIVPESKLVVLWQDQTVKIWKTLSTGKHVLMSKITLSDDENITSVDFKDNLLAVAKITSVKFFELHEVSETKFKVQKIRDENFDSLIEGAKKVKFIDDKRVLIMTPDEELYTFDIDAEEGKVNLHDEIELLAATQPQGKNQHLSCINNLIVTPDKQRIIISRFNGSIEVYPINNDAGEAYALTKLSTYPHLLQCVDDDKLVVLNEENKIFEFFINDKDGQLLTPWSRRNSEFLPRQFTSLQDKPQGMFVKDGKLWIYGGTWLSYFDLSLNIPISKAYKNTSTAKKRNNDGLSIDEDIDEVEEQDNIDILETSLRQSEIDKLRQKIQSEEDNSSKDKKPFWITEKYRPIMKVDSFGDNDIIIVERPYASLKTSPAFNLTKIKF